MQWYCTVTVQNCSVMYNIYMYTVCTIHALLLGLPRGIILLLQEALVGWFRFLWKNKRQKSSAKNYFKFSNTLKFVVLNYSRNGCPYWLFPQWTVYLVWYLYLYLKMSFTLIFLKLKHDLLVHVPVYMSWHAL